MGAKNTTGAGTFDAQAFLDSTGAAREVVAYRRSELIFAQGDAGDSLFYIQAGGVKLSAVSTSGREAVVAITLDQTSVTATHFLEHVVAQLPYRVEAILTDNAFAFTMRHAYHADRLTRFEQACRSLGIAHHLVRPRHPQSNGKVERFFRTVDDECLALQKRWTFDHRRRAIDRFVWFYNHDRPHLSLHGMTPVERRDHYFSSSQL